MNTSTAIDSLDVTAYRQADARLRRDGRDARDKREVSLVYAVYLVGSVRGVPERDKPNRPERLFSLAAITGCGLFYRLSLHLVRLFPLSFHWQIIATGIMGVVVMALIPQQTARTVITSQMLINLSESLGYKTPSKASTGLFVASFLGLGQLGFLFLTGSTTSLIAWGLLPADVREQFSWGYWFLAALPPTLVVIVIILAVSVFLYRPETHSHSSYKMVQTQLDILGGMSHKEWISLIVLLFTVGGWLTAPYHGIDGAWIAIIAFAVLVNTSILDWGMMRKGIDWELLIHMGVTLSLPTLMKQAKIDQWLIDVISPLILPFMDSPVWFFIVIALMTYVLNLVFTSFLAVVTLCVALLPLSIDVGMLTLLGGLDWIAATLASWTGHGFAFQLAVVTAVVLLLALVDLPFSWFRQFRIEQVTGSTE